MKLAQSRDSAVRHGVGVGPARFKLAFTAARFSAVRLWVTDGPLEEAEVAAKFEPSSSDARITANLWVADGPLSEAEAVVSAESRTVH